VLQPQRCIMIVQYQPNLAIWHTYILLIKGVQTPLQRSLESFIKKVGPPFQESTLLCKGVRNLDSYEKESGLLCKAVFTHL
jgi:hypothetical protein